MGDDIQAIKAGIIEIADLLIVNKADHDEVSATIAALEMNLNLKPKAENDWRPPVLKTIATTGEGVADAVEWISKHRAYLEANRLLETRERARFRAELEMVVQRELMARLLRGVNGGKIETLVEQIAAREIDVYAAAEKLIR
jgi:LAO/AO transport system kinase